ncbi:NAD(P)/FAD-dependent oxidoreductase [Streptomyces sp. NPDC091280]|uniref:NAD(P)/FAD-dependent oxidoreductase n=1 Tax=Streptomyces sp. NPDC091280 TaxID=3365984 RepID=UPI00382E6B1F
MKVLIVGAGAVGLSTAYWLHQAGHEVSVVERGGIAAGVSWGNAGEICPAVATPLAEPGLVVSALANVFAKGSALSMRPTQVLRNLPFFLRLLAKSNARDFRHGTRVLTELGKDGLELFGHMQSEIGTFQLVKDDYLQVYSSRERSIGSRDEYLSLFGETIDCGDILSTDELKAADPSLGTEARAGFFLRDQAYLDPGQFCNAIADYLRGEGAEIHTHTAVERLIETPGSVTAVTAAGDLVADRCVVAAGVWSAQLLKSIGVRIPMYPGKGYSFNIFPKTPPRHVLKLEEAHVGVVPMDSGVRVAGTMEFSGYGLSIDQRRIRSIIHAARPFLADVDWEARKNEWAGLRPLTPDGMPYVGRVGQGQVWVAAGHQMLGVLLAPSTGKRLADSLSGSEAPVMRHLAVR